LEEKWAENPETVNTSGHGDAAVDGEELHGKDGARAFAQRLNHAKEQWADEFQKQFFAEMGLLDPENGNPISDKASLQRTLLAMLAEQEEMQQRDAAQQMKIACLQELVTDLQDRQDADAMQKDPVYGAYFAEYGAESQRLADFARERGTPISLEAAFHTVLMKHLGDLVHSERERSKQEAMRTWQENRKASPAALGGASAERVVNYWQMPDSEFERVIQRALNGELKKNG